MSINIPKKPSLGGVIKKVGGGFFSKTWARLTGAGLGDNSRIQSAKARWSGRSATRDWRVRLTLPTQSPFKYLLLDNNDLMEPLQKSNGVFWPVTPAVIVQNSATYNPLAQTHSNYPFQAYQNSQVDTISIVGEFPVQNSEDAKHWIAVIKFLRTMTKMSFGQSAEDNMKGQPPPILHLSGYGDHVYDKVPVVINQFSVELRPGIDYISTKQEPAGAIGVDKFDNFVVDKTADELADASWAPTISTISCMVTPVYARETLKNFSLKKFADGSLDKERGIGLV
tara:strand:+ start:389 stop:1234 length:846 start_codon:yes stop_codon:yes gene_type:complete